MSVREFMEYIAFNQLEPFGDDREDMRAAIVPWFLSTVFRKKGRIPKFDDFLLSNMLKQPGEKPKQSVEQMEATLKGLVDQIKAQ